MKQIYLDQDSFKNLMFKPIDLTFVSLGYLLF